jgi:hypothetical protein
MVPTGGSKHRSERLNSRPSASNSEGKEGTGPMTGEIPKRESLTVEFKSDRNRLNDRDLIAAVVCLANTDGGDIYLGVEDDGTITGLHPAHQNLTV